MKRKIPVILLLLLCICFLAGCGCEHTWKEATCTEPMTCTSCGETEGSPRGHSWLVGTCEKAKHCEICELTEGEAPGHDWIDVTHYAPKTCRTCGQTEGESVPHKWMDATYYAPKTCAACKATKGSFLPRYDSDEIFIHVAGFDALYTEALRQNGLYNLWTMDNEEQGVEGPFSLFIVVDNKNEFTGLQLMIQFNEETEAIEMLSFAFTMGEGISQKQIEACKELCVLAYCQLNPNAQGKNWEDFLSNATKLGDYYYGEFDMLGYEITESDLFVGMLIVPDKALF